MLDQIKANRILFLDIETAGCAASFEELDAPLKHHWEMRFQSRLKEGDTLAGYFAREAGLHAEFSRVACACVGKLVEGNGGMKLEVCPYRDADEKKLLTELAALLDKLPNDVYLASHNGFEFDWPTLCRRMVVHGIAIPQKLWEFDRKPWLAHLLDTMSIWKFGERHHYCKMDLIAHLLGIPSSKDDIEGKDVSAAYWKGELDRIVKYCCKDVVVLANIILRLKGLPILQEADITIKN